jgi:hypothetical protein
MLKTDAMNNISTTATRDLLNFTVNIWFFIQNSNDQTAEQTLLAIGDVGPSNKSITLSITKTEEEDASDTSDRPQIPHLNLV